jgi:hypothetical protein
MFRNHPGKTTGWLREGGRVWRLAACVLISVLIGCHESSPIEVPEHPGPKPKGPPQSMSMPPVQTKPRNPNSSGGSLFSRRELEASA